MNNWLPQWVIEQHTSELNLRAMLQAELDGTLDQLTERQVWRLLFKMRARRALEPYLQIFKLAWEFCRGRYRSAFKKIRRGANQASGAGAGAQGVSAPGGTVAQFTGYGGGFSNTGGAGAGSVVNPPPTPFSFFEDAGIVAGEVTAYRCWRLKSDGKLYSVYMDEFCWEPGQIVEGEVDSLGGNGIHAFKSILLVAEYGGSSDTALVVGVVDLWGEVYEHQRGYRARYAAIKEIFDSPYYDADALRKLYGLKKKRAKKK